MKDKFSPKGFTQDLLVGIIILVLGTVMGYWVRQSYAEPLIEVDDNGGLYGRVNGMPVGSIFVGNSGYKTDRDVSIKIDDNIDEREVSIPGLFTEYIVKNVSGGTVITLKELRPGENAQIFFSPRDKTAEYFQILDILSVSNNIYNLYYIDRWNVAFEIKVLFYFFIILALFLGWYVPKRVSYYLERYKKTRRQLF